jgi:Endonuclease/Exonuclease/phosphatase family
MDTDGTQIRVATFNASLNRSAEGQLISDLTSADNAQAQAVAEIIQRTDADVILINEFDYDAVGQAARLFQQNYLSVGQNGAAPVSYSRVSGYFEYGRAFRFGSGQQRLRRRTERCLGIRHIPLPIRDVDPVQVSARSGPGAHLSEFSVEGHAGRAAS